MLAHSISRIGNTRQFATWIYVFITQPSLVFFLYCQRTCKLYCAYSHNLTQCIISVNTKFVKQNKLFLLPLHALPTELTAHYGQYGTRTRDTRSAMQACSAFSYTTGGLEPLI